MTDRARAILRAVALTTSALSGVVLAACAFLLAVGHVRAVERAPVDEARVLALEERVQIDSSVAPELNAERKRQADVTLEREVARDRIVTTLFVAATLFLASAKWASTLRGQRHPALKKLVELRLAGVAGAGGGLKPLASGSAPVPGDDGVVEATVEREGRGREAAIPILHAIQAHYRYLPEEALRRVCELTDISPAQLAGAAAFYRDFRHAPVGEHLIRVCHGTACHVSGARRIEDELRRHLGISDGTDTDAERQFTVDSVACLGCCSLAPVLTVDDQTAGRLTPVGACRALDEAREERA